MDSLPYHNHFLDQNMLKQVFENIYEPGRKALEAGGAVLSKKPL